MAFVLGSAVSTLLKPRFFAADTDTGEGGGLVSVFDGLQDKCD